MHYVRNIFGGALLACLISLPPCSGAIISTSLTSFGGSPADVTVTLDEDSMPGFLTITGLVGSDPTADLRGLFLDIGADLSGFDINGDVLDPGGIITERAMATNNLAGDNNVQGEIANLGFTSDLAFAFGTPGIGSDDIKTFTVKLANLTIADVAGVAVRATSVGAPNGPRSGSDKLFAATDQLSPPPDPAPVPEPASVMLIGLGLLTFGLIRSRRSR